MQVSRLLAKTETELPPCCLRVWPNDHSIIFLGTYKLEESSKTRHGSIEVHRLSNGQFENLGQTPVDLAILDLKFSPTDPLLLVSAQSTGEILIWKYDGTLELLQKVQVAEKDILVTSVFFSPGDENSLLATLTSGESLVVDLKTLDCNRLSTQHSLECWTGAFGELGPSRNVVFTGGDDAVLVAHDLRTKDKIWATNHRHHGAGVVLILCPSPRWLRLRPNDLWTGTYDDHLRVFDLRKLDGEDGPYLYQSLLPTETYKENLNGGVWRLIPAPDSDKILACCMYDGARVIEPDNGKFTVSTYFKGHHESMCYGGDWAELDKIITCSFYDNVVQAWLPSHTS